MTKRNYKFNWPLIGNAQITEFLEKSIINDKVAGTYIFTGPDNLGKTTVANYFAQCLLCESKGTDGHSLPCGRCGSCHSFSVNAKLNSSRKIEKEKTAIHGDFHIVKRDKNKKNISIKQVRELIKILNLSSFLNSYKIGIIKHADIMSQGAFNALLKTLEEPKDKVIVILIVKTLESLPDTIVSRSQILRFAPVKADEIYDFLLKNYRASRSEAKNISRLSLGRPALAVKFFEDKEFYDNYCAKVKIFLNFISHGINERFSLIEDITKKKALSQEVVKDAKRTLEIWQGVIRDWLLLEYGFNDLIQHQMQEAEIIELKRLVPVNKIINLVRAMRQAEEFLSANVNPKLVLENIAVQI